MNQGRVWCVVSPTVGLPLFLGSVAITSLIVHASVMSHTSWMSNYWQGKAGRVAENTVPAVPGGDTKALAGYSMTVTPVPATNNAQASFMVTLAPTTTAVTAATDLTAKPPGTVASR